MARSIEDSLSKFLAESGEASLDAIEVAVKLDSAFLIAVVRFSYHVIGIVDSTLEDPLDINKIETCGSLFVYISKWNELDSSQKSRILDILCTGITALCQRAIEPSDGPAFYRYIFLLSRMCRAAENEDSSVTAAPAPVAAAPAKVCFTSLLSTLLSLC
jgi:hypothetical protein